MSTGIDYAALHTDDARVQGIDPLIQPLLLRHQFPLSPKSKFVVQKARVEAVDVITGKDELKRVVVIVGPCSLHDPIQAIDYATRLSAVIPTLPNLVILMRAYFEKPRTTVGWKGLINDPDLDGSFQINKGLGIARGLLRDITELGVPVGCELLDTISPQFLSDCVSWGAIGARTTESQLHRELASGVSFPIGFKNGTDGSVSVAVDAMRAAEHPHCFLGVTPQGLAGVVKTTGNKDVHIILRGGNGAPNYEPEFVKSATEAVRKARPTASPSIMIDCSHGNSQKDYRNQHKVLHSICSQLRSPSSQSITGVMIESHMNAGKQDIPASGRAELKYGVSVTDGCVDWEETVVMLKELDDAVRARREGVPA